jgi:hypothetical protein
MKKCIFISLIISMGFISVNAFAQTDEYNDLYTTGRIDTIHHNDLTLLFFNGILDIRVEGLSKLLVLSGPDTLLRLANEAIFMYDFCQQKLDTSLSCIFRDIDHDGNDEIIIDEYGGGNACCHDVYIYSLSNPPKRRSKISASSASIQMEDLDGDSIPELEYSEYRSSWVRYASVGSNSTLLIWKWDGDSLRLANYKIKSIILKDTLDLLPGLKQEMALPDSSYNPQKWDNTYPTDNFKLLLETYAYGGKPNLIDSVFDEYWPSYNPGKEDFHKKFMYDLGVNNMWTRLQNSDW